MLHPAIYFVFLDDEVELTLPATRVRDDDLYIFFPYQNGSSYEQTILDFFDTVAYEVKDFYGNELLRDEIIISEVKSTNKFITLASVHQKLLNLSPWNPDSIKKRYGYTRQLRSGIRESYELYVTLMDMQASIMEGRSRIRTRLLQNEFLT